MDLNRVIHNLYTSPIHDTLLLSIIGNSDLDTESLLGSNTSSSSGGGGSTTIIYQGNTMTPEDAAKLASIEYGALVNQDAFSHVKVYGGNSGEVIGIVDAQNLTDLINFWAKGAIVASLTPDNIITIELDPSLLDYNTLINKPFELDEINNRWDATKIVRFPQGSLWGNYVANTPGAGAALTIDSVTGHSYLEVDRLYVRLKAYFDTLVIKRKESIGGEFIVSPANMKCIKVDELADVYRCYFLKTQDGQSITNDFTVGTLAICKLTNADTTISGNTLVLKYYWRLVTNVGDDYIDLSKTDCDVDSDIPSANDSIIALGHRTDIDRQSAIVISSIDNNAPHMVMYQGINSYSLNDKSTVEFGYNSATNLTETNIYGKTYIGPRNQSSYINFNPLTELLDIKGNLRVSTGETVSSLIAGLTENMNDYVSALNLDIDNLQNQIDGQIISYFEEYNPTLNNFPANEWTTDTLKLQHANDTFTNTLTGGSWRWQQVNSIWQWGVITDTATLLALLLAAQALDTADSKRRTFITTPTTPYDLGDIWLLGSTGDIKHCILSRLIGSYNASDWIISSKYTDNTLANQALLAALDALVDANAANSEIANISNDNILSPVEKSGERSRWNDISTEKTKLNTLATTYEITTENTAYNTAFQNLANYLNNGITWSNGIPSWLSDTQLNINTTIVGTTYRSMWNDYYSTRLTLLNAIATKAKTLTDNAALAAINALAAADNAQTSANTANILLADIANDSKLVASEKLQVKTEWDIIVSEKTKNDTLADNFTVSKTAYDNAYDVLNTYITPLLSNLTTTSDIVSNTFRTNFKNYYDAKTDLLNAIAIKAKSLANTALSDATNALNNYASLQYLKAALTEDTIISGGLILSSILSLGYTSGSIFNVMAGTSGLYDSSKNGGGIAGWYGGSMKDKAWYTPETTPLDVAKTLFRFDGSGYIGNLNIFQNTTWTSDTTIQSYAPSFEQVVFLRSATTPGTPSGGSYQSSLPTGWNSTILSGTNDVYVANRTYVYDAVSEITIPTPWHMQPGGLIGSSNYLKAYLTTYETPPPYQSLYDDQTAPEGWVLWSNSMNTTGYKWVLIRSQFTRVTPVLSLYQYGYTGYTKPIHYYLRNTDGVTITPEGHIIGKDYFLSANSNNYISFFDGGIFNGSIGSGSTGGGITNINTTGSGNAITSVSLANNSLTFNKDINFSLVGHTHAWSDIVSGKPTSIAGYGISDAMFRDDRGITGWQADDITYSVYGFGYQADGFPVNGSFISFGGLGNRYVTQIQSNYFGEDLYFRARNDDNHVWHYWRKLLHSGNYNDYVPTITGGGASGTWGINISGNSATSTLSASLYNGYYIDVNADNNKADNSLISWYAWSQTTINTPNSRYTLGITQIAPDSNFGFQIAKDVRSAGLYHRDRTSGIWSNWRELAHIDDNVASASKLQTTRYIFGQPFDGTGNVDGYGIFNGYVRTNGGYFSAGEYADDSYGYVNVTRPSDLNNASCFSWVRSGNAAFGLGYNNNNQIVLGGANINKTINPWLTIGYSDITTNANIVANSLGISNTSATSGYGLSLYGGAVTGKPTYGIFFGGTATFGTHGGVTSDWATYLTMSDTTNRGWIFQRGTTNVASIDGNGNMLLNGDIQAGNNLYANKLFVNQFFAKTLTVQEAIHQGGIVVRSAAGAIIIAVTDNGTSWRCTHNATNDFVVNDLVFCQRFTGTSLKRYWRKAIAVGTGYVDLSKTDCESGSSDPEVGDNIAVMGNSSDTTRQSIQVDAAMGTSSPYRDDYIGVNSYLLPKPTTRLGNLSGITDPYFGALSGNGLYSTKAYLNGAINSSSGKIGGWTLSSNALTCNGETTAQINVEVSGSAFLHINAADRMLEIRNDGTSSNKYCAYITTFGGNGTALYALANSSGQGHAIEAHGNVILHSRSEELIDLYDHVNIRGLSLYRRSVNSSQTLLNTDNIIVTSTDSRITLGMPSDCHDGHILIVRKTGAGNITFNGATFHRDFNSTASSVTLGNGSIAIFIYQQSLNTWTANYMAYL